MRIIYQVVVEAANADLCDRVIGSRVFHEEEILDGEGEPFTYTIDTIDGMSDCCRGVEQ